jgi:dihydrofolate reductase
VKEGGTTFTFVTEGLNAAVAQAREAAGDRNVLVAGGASLAQQGLRAGAVDEVQIHLAPLMLGDGVRLLEGLDPEDVRFELMRVIESPAATHLRYRVVK